MRTENKPCPSCEYLEPRWKTVHPDYKNHPELGQHFLDSQETLQRIYAFKHHLKAKMGILDAFSQSEEMKGQIADQRKIVLERLDDIEAYFIDIVIKMYCSK
jgi:hypothetical protein